MSNVEDIRSAYNTHYVQAVIRDYQKSSILLPYTNQLGSFIGNQARFTRQHKSKGQDINRNSWTQFPTREFNNIIATPKYREVGGLYLDIDRMETVNYPSIFVTAGLDDSAALGRAIDQIAINDGLGSASQTPKDWSTSGITLEGLLDLEMTMNDNAVPAENRVLLIGSRQAMQLKMIPEYINQLNVGYHVLPTGKVEATTFCGFRFLVMEEREEGGLPVDNYGNKRCYAYDVGALGLLVSMLNEGETQRLANWGGGALFVHSVVRAASACLNEKGIYPLDVKNS